jgi:ribosome-associated heat shock protein Hsp15
MLVPFSPAGCAADDFDEFNSAAAKCSFLYENNLMETLRIDKWLWVARFFKTRALASKACDLGRIRSNGVEAKPAREIHVGDKLEVKNEGGEFQIEVLALSLMRGPAVAAQALYRESEESKAARAKAAEERKAMQQYAPLPEHRPTKRDRRRIIQFRGRG